MGQVMRWSGWLWGRSPRIRWSPTPRSLTRYPGNSLPAVRFGLRTAGLLEWLRLLSLFLPGQRRWTPPALPWCPGLWTGTPTLSLSLIHISEPTRLRRISYAVFCLKKKKHCQFFFFFLMIRRPPRSTPLYSSAASDVYKRQGRLRPYPGARAYGRAHPHY